MKTIIKSIEIEVGGKTLKLSPEEVKELRLALDELAECDKPHYQPYYVPYYQPYYTPTWTTPYCPKWTFTGTSSGEVNLGNATLNVLQLQ